MKQLHYLPLTLTLFLSSIVIFAQPEVSTSFFACQVYAPIDPIEEGGSTNDTSTTPNALILKAGKANAAELVSAVTIYPNPATDEVNIAVSSEFAINQIKLYAVDGREVETSIAHQTDSFFTLSISHLPPGIYTVQLLDTSGQKTLKRLVKTNN